MSRRDQIADALGISAGDADTIRALLNEYDGRDIAAVLAANLNGVPPTALDDLTDVATAGGTEGDVLTQQNDGSFALEAPSGGSTPVGENAGTPATDDTTGTSLAAIPATLPTPPDSNYYWGGPGDEGASDWYAPFPVYTPTIITGLQIYVYSSTGQTSGKNVRLAIYSADDNFQPVELIGQTGELDVDSVAEGSWLSGPLAADAFLTPGNYFVAGSSDDAGDQVWYPAVFTLGPVYWPGDQTETTIGAIFRDRGYGSFPQTLDPWTDAEVDSTQTGTTIPVMPVTRSNVIVSNPSSGNIIQPTGPGVALEVRGSGVFGQNSAILSLRQDDEGSYMLLGYNNTFSADQDILSLYLGDDGSTNFHAGVLVINPDPGSSIGLTPGLRWLRFLNGDNVGHAIVCEAQDLAADDDMIGATFTFCVDPTPGATKILFKAKDTNGAVRTGNLALS